MPRNRVYVNLSGFHLLMRLPATGILAAHQYKECTAEDVYISVHEQGKLLSADVPRGGQDMTIIFSTKDLHTLYIHGTQTMFGKLFRKAGV
jgi:hypothetical protein